MLDWLNKYLEETPLQQLQEEWKEIENLFPSGVNAFEHIELSKQYFNCGFPPGYQQPEINLTSNMTSNFSGSFFLV